MQDVPVDTGPRVTACDDPRITRLGHILRDTKLNEFPQFLNVLKGEMSLVGPRPEDPKYVALYTPEQRRVLSVTPGITSVASILYRNEEEMMCQDTLEETYVNVIMPHKLGLDLEYVDHRSFLVDLDILLRTVLALPPLFARAAPDVEELLFGPVQSFVRRSLSWFSLDFMLGLLGISMASFVWQHAGTPVNAGRPWPYRMALTAGIALTFTLVNQAYGLHHSLWSYASGQEVVDILVATALSTVLSLIAGGIGFHLPPEWILLTGFFSFALFTAARYRTRLIRGARWRWRDLRQKPLDEARTRLLIVGTGGAGRLLAWWIQSQHYGRRYQIVGFVDGDLTRRGLRIRGLEILGGCRAIPALVARHKIDIIVVTVPDADTLDQQIILDICHSTPAQVEIIPDILKFIREPGQASPGRD
jgi:hypothetical protein